MKRIILIYGACGGLLIVILQLVEYRFLVIEHSVEIYGALVAAIFAGVGIWLGLKLSRTQRIVVVKEMTLMEAFPVGLLITLISSLILKRKTPKGELAEAKA